MSGKKKNRTSAEMNWRTSHWKTVIDKSETRGSKHMGEIRTERSSESERKQNMRSHM